MNMNHLIVKWNQERGLLSKGFDPALELKMLSEEANEFYNADSFEHRLCEYADFKFVKAGTIAKNHAQTGLSITMFENFRARFVQLMEWSEEVEANMVSLLLSEKAFLDRDGTLAGRRFEELVDLALTIVITNNDYKGGKKDADGKVVKAERQIKPEALMRELIYAD
jgi:hypothetical protein